MVALTFIHCPSTTFVMVKHAGAAESEQYIQPPVLTSQGEVVPDAYGMHSVRGAQLATSQQPISPE